MGLALEAMVTEKNHAIDLEGFCRERDGHWELYIRYSAALILLLAIFQKFSSSTDAVWRNEQIWQWRSESFHGPGDRSPNLNLHLQCPQHYQYHQGLPQISAAETGAAVSVKQNVSSAQNSHPFGLRCLTEWATGR